MAKKVIESDHNIEVKDQDESIEVWVNGQLFLVATGISVEEVDDSLVLKLIEENYNNWDGPSPVTVDRFRIMSDGMTCADSRS